jgi:hypothetical protein
VIEVAHNPATAQSQSRPPSPTPSRWSKPRVGIIKLDQRFSDPKGLPAIFTAWIRPDPDNVLNRTTPLPISTFGQTITGQLADLPINRIELLLQPDVLFA